MIDIDKLKELWKGKKLGEDDEGPINRREARARERARVRCPRCYARIVWSNSDAHSNKCRGSIQIPKKYR